MTSNFRRACPCAALTLAIFSIISTASRADDARVTFSGDVPHGAINRAADTWPMDPSARMDLAITLPLRNPAALDDLLARLYTPSDPGYGQYLTSDQFTEEFGPTQASYDAVIAFANANGLTVTGTHKGRTVLDVAGPVSAVESAFRVQIRRFTSSTGRMFYAPDRDPSVPASMADDIDGVVGLDNVAMQQPGSIHPISPDLTRWPANITGTGPGGGLAPRDIKTAYNLTHVTANGSGQSAALLEFDGYAALDVTGYETNFFIPAVPLQNVLIDGFDGAPHSTNGRTEATLDIEMLLALAPHLSQIYVYEAPNTAQGGIDGYTQMADDDSASVLSSSWTYATEAVAPSSVMSAENAAFRRMAAQGQSMFVDSGDGGAYAGGSSLAVGDPSSQPYVTCVGGTNLTTNGAGGAWVRESSWGDPSDQRDGMVRGHGSGGGISSVWPIPSYQAGFVSAASLGSTSMRNIPDVSLFGDGDTGGYCIVVDNVFESVAGTSAATPLWAAFTALVNQSRAAVHRPPLGFANPGLYGIARTPRYGVDFHDIADHSTNLYYPAVTGYDLSTGLGSFNAANLGADLSVSPGFATYLGMDSGTQGNWKGVYGAAGWNVMGDTSSNNPTYPSDMRITPGDHQSGVWAASTLASIGLQSTEVGSANRVAGYWCGTSWSINVDVSGTQDLALYLLDADDRGYAETITIRDAVTGAVLSSENVSEFTGGVYYLWSVSGNVNITLTSTAGHWAVLSGIFIGGGGSGHVAPAPPAELSAAPGSQSAILQWYASAGATSYNVYRGVVSQEESPTPIATGIRTTSYTDTGLAINTTYYYKIVSVNAVGGGFASAQVSATIPPSTLTFVRADTSTQGNWKGAYGGDGWLVVGDPSTNNPQYPSYAACNTGSHYSEVWSASSLSPAALQSTAAGSATRLAGAWYQTSWTVNLQIHNTHQFALYFLDMSGYGYAESVTITDTATWAVLDSRTVSSMSGGVYYVYSGSGSLRITLTSTVGSWAVLSGIFFGPGSGAAAPLAPSNLSTSLVGRQVNLTWRKSTPITGVSYNLYRGMSAGGESATPIASVTAATYLDTHVAPGATYYYKVVAVNAVGGSFASTEASARVP